MGSSPLTRGTPSSLARINRVPRIIPAYAGNTLGWPSMTPRQRDHPRLRGEHTKLPKLTTSKRGSSPLTRGTRAPDTWTGLPSGIIPAYAGNTCQRPGRESPRSDHPRLRGEHLASAIQFISGLGSSPLTRGTRHLRAGDVVHDGIIPAYAGNTDHPAPPSQSKQDHPRLRGEHAVVGGGWVAGSGSSPLTRGTRERTLARPVPLWIIPAYAGNTSCSSRFTRSCRDHPRLRGEHSAAVRLNFHICGSSPLTRGTLEAQFSPEALRGIIPAYAGNTVLGRLPDRRLADHPRLRGEHETWSEPGSTSMGSSPLTRGTRGPWGLAATAARIIPAYAGNTSRWLRSRKTRKDHPRLRGEHWCPPSLCRCYSGSSPLTRGTPWELCGGLGFSRIIPAYAGNTPIPRPR